MHPIWVVCILTVASTVPAIAFPVTFGFYNDLTCNPTSQNILLAPFTVQNGACFSTGNQGSQHIICASNTTSSPWTYTVYQDVQCSTSPTVITGTGEVCFQDTSLGGWGAQIQCGVTVHSSGMVLRASLSTLLFVFAMTFIALS